MEYTHLFPAVVAMLITCVAQALLLKSKWAKKTLDYPNHRSLHRQPTARTGGIAMALGIAAGWLVLPAAPWLPALSLAALALLAVSLTDDMRGLSATLRLTVHFAICAAFLAALGLEWSWSLLLLLPMVWGVNLYNFMDGLDGLAAGMTVLGFAVYALLAALHGNAAVALLSFCVAAAALGFLPFNFAPARVFLGDAGSIPLGFLASAIGIIGWNARLWPLWLPVVIFSPFIVDATVTLGMRAARGARLAEAHREHYYQRLAQSGLGHRNTALLEYALMLVAGAAAVMVVMAESAAAAIALGVIEIACLVAIDLTWKRNQMDNGQHPQQGPRT
jgi:UDP-N-acetylmuramyl pentapeptide phosphotransferase/UDP-N-acetylglucosamine-1-phosphate transferase